MNCDGGKGQADETRSVRASVLSDHGCRAAAWILGALTVLTLLIPYIDRRGMEQLVSLLAQKQDLPVAVLLLVILPLSARYFRKRVVASGSARVGLIVGIAIVSILTLGWVGHYVVFSGYDLSRDEQMASFDAAIFSKGQLFTPIPLSWRQFAEALNLRFILSIGSREAWVSGYLPVNAAFRAALGYVSDPALASPLMAALGLFCIWRISARLWPESTRTQVICVLIYVGSSQILVTSMTSFAMSMHLALNMLWLWLFLLDRPRTHVAAIGVGWLATGIHQPLFHPLFVLPFFILMARQKRWTQLACYGSAYVAIGIFWMAWPLWLSSHAVAPPAVISDSSGVGFIERLETVLRSPLYDPWMMVPNLLRFVCWQHPLLLPLVIVGVSANWRQSPLCRALSVGVVLPVIVMGVLLPWQGHGWGYRYLHPILGNVVLLAGYGWRALEDRRIDASRAMYGTSALAMLILFPWHAAMAHRLATPYAQLHIELMAINADLVIVDTEGVAYGEDLIFNSASLDDRPKLLIARFLAPRDLSLLCQMGSVAFVPNSRLASVTTRIWSDRPPTETPTFTRLAAAAKPAGCIVNNSFTKMNEDNHGVG